MFPHAGLLALAFLPLVACGTKDRAISPPASAGTASSSVAGGVETVEVTATGKGATRDEAIREAVLRAVEQVHGRAISMKNVSQELGSVTKQKGMSVMGVGASKSETERQTVGGRQITEETSGMVTSLRVVKEDEGRSSWEVTVVAMVAKFTTPGTGKPTVIIGRPKGDGITDDDADVIRERIATALTASGQLTMLDRSSDADIDNELELASSDAVSSTEALKQGQGKVADFVVQITVETLRVDRNARTLRMTGREIVSYDGRANASFRLVHVATRQVMGSGSATASRTSEEGLQDSVNADAWKRDLIEEIAGKLAVQVSAPLTKAGGAAAPPPPAR
jgi:hypothetical protein